AREAARRRRYTRNQNCPTVRNTASSGRDFLAMAEALFLLKLLAPQPSRRPHHRQHDRRVCPTDSDTTGQSPGEEEVPSLRRGKPHRQRRTAVENRRV